jgi:cytidylate kinase
VDNEVIEQAGEWVELAPEYVGDVERRKRFLDRVLGLVTTTSSPVPVKVEGRVLPPDADIRQLIKQVLASFAEGGSVVIVAHAASFALAGRDVLRVLVTASPDTRAKRLAAGRGVDDRAAARLIRQEDAGRANYLKQFYGVEDELPTHFDLVVNTDVMTPEKASETIVAAAG